MGPTIAVIAIGLIFFEAVSELLGVDKRQHAPRDKQLTRTNTQPLITSPRSSAPERPGTAPKPALAEPERGFAAWAAIADTELEDLSPGGALQSPSQAHGAPSVMPARGMEQPHVFVLEQWNECHTRDETTDMSPPGHAAGFATHSGSAEQLEYEPETEYPPRGQVHHPRQQPKREEHHNPRVRKEQQVRTQYARNCTAGADGGNGRSGIGQRMGHAGENTAQQIEHDEPAMTHAILDVVTEYPQIEHVADEMHPPAVKKLRGK